MATAGVLWRTPPVRAGVCIPVTGSCTPALTGGVRLGHSCYREAKRALADDIMNPTPPDSAQPMWFEDALTDLEAIVRELEAGDSSLEESLARYEHGVGLLKHCYTQLRQAEQRVLLLSGEDADGKPATQPFEHPSLPDPA